jgi:hypothetical protein
MIRRRRELRSPSSATQTTTVAHRVPWEVDRSAPPLYRLVNTSGEVLHGVTVSISGRSRLSVSAPSAVVPGAAVDATVTGPDIEADTILVVRWFRPDGTEYLWNVSF